jgi:CBS domain-containing protein
LVAELFCLGNEAVVVEGMLKTAREKLVTISDDAKLVEAAKLLSSGIDLVIVCDGEGALLGVVTKTDVVRQISACQGATCMCPASTVMTRDVALCRGTDRLEDVSKLMKERHLKNIPVVDGDNRPLGVLTARAVLRVLLSDAEYEEAQMVDYVKGVGYR